MLICLSSLTGGIMVLLWYGIGLILERIGFVNIVFELLKMVVLFFLIPIAYVGLQTYIAYSGSGFFSPTPSIVQSCRNFVLLWAAGAMMALLYIIHDYSLLRKCSKDAFECSADTRDIFEELKLELLQGRNQLQIRQSYQTTTPYVQGFPTPRVILPVESYTKDELRVILTHEMMHYKQKDLQLKLVMQIVMIFHYFNPLAWVLMFKIQKWSEYACDLRASEHVGGIKPYFNVMLSIWTENPLKSQLSSQLVTDKHELVVRMKKLVRINNMKRKSKLCALLVLCTAFMLSSTTVCAATIECAERYVDVEARTSVEDSATPRISSNTHRISTEYGDTPGITCIEGEVQTQTRGTYGFEWEVPVGSRVYGPYFSVDAGDEVAVSVFIDPTYVDIRVGLEDSEGYRYYAEGSDYLSVIFPIQDSRRHRVYIQNNSGTDVSVTGTYMTR